MLSGLDAATCAIPAPWPGDSNIFSLGKADSPPLGERFFNVFVVSVLDSAGIVAAAGCCKAGVVIEKKCLFIADGSETRRL